ncbi:tyrosine-type recombinase/integrase [Pseudomonas syringae group genomosp. 3]|nr:tyrosine-type recombinase/integrase [Pseudomonas syringae group genomosp. 3]KPY90535.1 Site-specific recombinase, phage integrase family [Pseudomonas syringae pv. tomato]
MKTKITGKTISRIVPAEKVYRIHDTLQPGLSIRVLPSGHASYMVTWARNKAATLGRVGVITLEQARTDASRYLADAHAIGEPVAITEKRTGAAMPTLDHFLTHTFEPWAAEHHRDAKNGNRAIRHSFEALLSIPLSSIDTKRVEQIRTAWLRAGLAPSTANRNITRLRGVLSRALEWGVLQEHPLKVRKLKVDDRSRVRYLSIEEETALREALEARSNEMRDARDSANKWRLERHKEPLADLRAVRYADHLEPLVVLSINTGVRRGEAFNLTWADVDLKNKLITVEGDTSKSGQTRHVPLNREALDTLTKWKEQRGGNGFVFPGQHGKRLDNVKKSWSGLLKLAKVERFRWHDLRHTFASKLVMAGVPLNTVRELLGHTDIKMTLRYAHLAPGTKAAAVELI